MSVRVASSLVALAAGLVACGPSGAPANVGNTRADAAHVAAQATEPRVGDPTAAHGRLNLPLPNSTTATTPSTPAASSSASVARSTSAPTPSGTGAAGAAGHEGAPAEPSTEGTTGAPTAAATAEPPKKISARHVLVQWMGSDRAGKSVLRTRDQALVLAKEVLRRARAGDDLARLANEYSDEPNAGPRGGSLGRFGKGQMVGAFEQVAFKLEVGQLSDIVETPFGFHIIQRTE